MEMMIRPRPPTRGGPGPGDSNAQRFITEDTVSQLPEKKQEEEIEKIVNPAPIDEPSQVQPQQIHQSQHQPKSPFKFLVEDYDQKPGEKKESIPKFGRRRPSVQDDYSAVRTRTNVIEGNPDYVRYTMDYNRQQKNFNDSTDSYQEAVEKRSNDMRKHSTRKDEDRTRANSNVKFQKETFTSSSDPRESSEEPFQVLEKTVPSYDSTSTNDESFPLMDNQRNRQSHAFFQRESSESSEQVRDTHQHRRHGGHRRTSPRQDNQGAWYPGHDRREAQYDKNSNSRAMGYDQKMLDRNQNNSFNIVGDKPLKPTGWMKPEWYDIKY